MDAHHLWKRLDENDSNSDEQEFQQDHEEDEEGNEAGAETMETTEAIMEAISNKYCNRGEEDVALKKQRADALNSVFSNILVMDHFSDSSQSSSIDDSEELWRSKILLERGIIMQAQTDGDGTDSDKESCGSTDRNQSLDTHPPVSAESCSTKHASEHQSRSRSRGWWAIPTDVGPHNSSRGGGG
eukprot:scaffold7064_cov111-Cylindrotheca_fusiformis.AAC.8